MCSQLEFGIADLESMLNEVGIFLGKFCLWYCIPNTELDQGLLPIKDNDEVDSMIVLLCYSKCMNLYTTDNVIDYGADFGDFSMTQYEEDERVERIEQIREEREYGGDGHGEADGEGIGAGGAEGKLKSDDDDKVSFEGDSSNLDSTDSEVDTLPKKQKKPRRIPPPNPPYRTRKRGRYSMLRGLFKNTADNPVVLDDSGPAGSQPSQEEVVHDQGKTETTEKKGKKAVPRKKVTKPEEKKKKSAKQNERKTMKQNERKTVKQDEKKSAKKKEKVEDFGQTNASQILQLEEEEEIEQLIAQGTVVGEEEEQTGRRNYCSCTEDCEVRQLPTTWTQ
ncbi:uncharacterized protein LOC108226119 [Daucus carota subsp. sativus]|uniref:uncharacterized protein LOC108226119 n=1 Tax=Daucus carota subsp. sativus TaxID=79200 RepID=UPI003082A326